MKQAKMLSLAGIASMAVMAFFGASAASAVTLEQLTSGKPNDVLSNTAPLTSSLKAATSAVLKNTSGSIQDTCTLSSVAGNLTENAPDPHGNISTLEWGSKATPCSETTDTITAGSLTIGTGGAVTSTGAEVTVNSTIFGISCKFRTGTGTNIGTLTKAASASADAEMDISAVLTSDFCGSGTWQGTYSVTTPQGLTYS